MPAPRLQEIDGLGEAAVAELKIVEAVARRLARGTLRNRKQLSSFSDVLDYCRTTTALAEREEFRILFLDKRNRLVADEVQGRGAVDHTPVYPGNSCAGRSSSPPPRSSSSKITRRAIQRRHPPISA